ncbi:hypothetical protein, partial [Mycobacterium tuberculosis]|uniref:hypothetical protein n=1 Tax=Mycobacterium tuberculosis TaxID=1773 RepID=UPI001BDF21D7
MIVVFDLDDTLYDELTYVQSGFQAVAGYLRDTYGMPAGKALDWMVGRQRYAKPSPYCFQKICAREGASPDQVV